MAGDAGGAERRGRRDDALTSRGQIDESFAPAVIRVGRLKPGANDSSICPRDVSRIVTTSAPLCATSITLPSGVNHAPSSNR